MAGTVRSDTHEYTIRQEIVDVTSLDRTDTDWTHVDRCGHVHMYFPPDKPYSPSQRYRVPTLAAVHERAFWEDGEPYTVTHYECVFCREIIRPGTTSDEYRQYIPGLKHYIVDGHTVSPYDFYVAVAEDIGLPWEYRAYAWQNMLDIRLKERQDGKP